MDQTKLRLYDNTRLDDAKRCLRFYYFRHVRHWKSTREGRLPLIFGSGWHAAMDRLWETTALRKPRNVIIESAFGAFITAWIKEGGPPPHEIDLALSTEMLPRTPAVALEMLEDYLEKRMRNIQELEILEIERPFAVPLSPTDDTLFYVGRMDKIVRPTKSSVRGYDHKTTTSMRLDHTRKVQRISPQHLDSYSPNSQMDGYLYALHLLYPEESRAGKINVYADVALVHKVGQDTQFVPVDKQIGHLDAWLWDAHYWIGQIEQQREALDKVKPDDKYMAAFAKETRSCFDFNSACPYLELCKSRPNPESWDVAPAGYVENKWDPLDHIGTPKELT